MKEKVKAKILWLSREQGGRSSFPTIGSRFGSIIVAKGILLNPHKECWSLIIEIGEKLAEFETIADVCYLSDEAPNNLEKGFEFDLYDGNKLVASGIIL